jgi:acyl phosphate:glycerol-3-phosphate acyltransferase
LPALLIVFSYLLGAIPTAYIVGRLVKGIDIRGAGDGNVGAANAFREIGPVAGLSVMLFDICKGVAATLITQAFGYPQIVVFAAGFAVVAGHIWSPFIGFKGGRGEATASGVLVALLPIEMFILLAIALVPFLVTHRNTMVLGAILFAPLWLASWIMGASISLICYSIALPILVGLTHFFTTRRLPPEVRQRGKFMR